MTWLPLRIPSPSQIEIVLELSAAIDDFVLPAVSLVVPCVSRPLPPHSHSIILSDRIALNSKRKSFLHTTKNRLADPSEICALEFKGEFRRFGI